MKKLRNYTLLLAIFLSNSVIANECATAEGQEKYVTNLMPTLLSLKSELKVKEKRVEGVNSKKVDKLMGDGVWSQQQVSSFFVNILKSPNFKSLEASKGIYLQLFTEKLTAVNSNENDKLAACNLSLEALSAVNEIHLINLKQYEVVSDLLAQKI